MCPKIRMAADTVTGWPPWSQNPVRNAPKQKLLSINMMALVGKLHDETFVSYLGLAMSPRLVSNSWFQAIHLPQLHKGWDHGYLQLPWLKLVIVYKVNYELITCLNMGSIPKMSHYAPTNGPEWCGTFWSPVFQVRDTQPVTCSFFLFCDLL